MGGGAWWAVVHGVTKSRTQLSDFTFTFHFHALEKEMATHSSVLTYRTPGMGEPGELPSMGSHRVGHYWNDLAAAAAATKKIKHVTRHQKNVDQQFSQIKIICLKYKIKAKNKILRNKLSLEKISQVKHASFQIRGEKKDKNVAFQASGEKNPSLRV